MTALGRSDVENQSHGYHVYNHVSHIGGLSVGQGGGKIHSQKFAESLQSIWTGYADSAQITRRVLLSTHADMQGVDISFTVSLFVCVCVCTVTYFSAEDKASIVTFCTAVYQRPRQGILQFLWTLLSQKPKIARIGQHAGHAHPHVNITVATLRRKRHARDAPFVKSRGVWTYDRHVWIYVSPRRRTYLLTSLLQRHRYKQRVIKPLRKNCIRGKSPLPLKDPWDAVPHTHTHTFCCTQMSTVDVINWWPRPSPVYLTDRPPT